MKLVNHKSLQTTQGNLLLVYSLAGTGKTVTVLQTAEDPIIYLTAEGRKISTSMAAIARPDLRMKVGVYDGFNDLIETCMNLKKFEGATTIFLDSLTHLMVVHLSQEILSENYMSKNKKEQDAISKELAAQVKMSVESYGVLSGQMTRLMRALQGLTMAGYDVICSARSDDRPKWNRALANGPALMGKEFSKGMDGFFDFIAYLEPDDRDKDDKGDPPGSEPTTAEMWKYYAPYASFNPNDDYLAKYTGVITSRGIVHRKLHVRKLFAEANGDQ